MKKIILVLIFLFLLSGFSEEIKLPEEKIFGESKKIQKTQIYLFTPEIGKIKIPELEISEIKIEKKNIELKESKIEKIKNELCICGGNFDTARFSFTHREKELLFKLYNNYTGGYRENDARYLSGFFLNRKRKRYNLSFNIEKGKNELPGPIYSPFYTDNNFLVLKSFFRFNIDKNDTIYLSQSYYKIDDLKTNFSAFEFDRKFENFSLISAFRRQDFFHQFSKNSFYQGLCFKIKKGEIKSGIKVIESSGVRFMPQLKYPVNRNMYFKVGSIYRMPDLWKDVIKENWAEIKDNYLNPEEGYFASLNFGIIKEDYKLKAGVKYDVWRSFYTWADIDKNFLFQPDSQRFNEWNFNFSFSNKVLKNFEYFVNWEKSIRSKSIEYFPENKADGGIIFTYTPLILKVWAEYYGKRISDGDELGGFSLLNCEIKYKRKHYEVGVKLENVADKKYFVVKGYPATGREITGYFKYYF